MKISRKCIEIGFPLAFAIYVGLLVAGHFRMKDRIMQGLRDSKSSSIQIKACTFNHFTDSFPNNSSSRKGAHDTGTDTTGDKNSNSTCWKLSDEIIRVPATAIANHNNLIPLGSGKLSGVYKATLRLRNNKLCAAVIKTDQCRASWWSLTQTSCLTDHSTLWHPRSFTGAEYTGALVWYAQRKLGTTVPGLLPTWAVIQDEEHPLYSPPITFQELEGFPHPDASIKGVIMPLWAFTPVSDILVDKVNNSNNHRTTTTTRLAQIMLPAAQGLEFVGNMGLAFRDLIEKNVGLLSSTGEGIVYDHSFMGVQQVQDCRSVACNFCMEQAFPPFDDYYHHVIKGIRSGHPYILGDTHNFRSVIVKLLAQTCLDQQRAAEMTDDVVHTADVHDLIRVLTKYAAAAAVDAKNDSAVAA